MLASANKTASLAAAILVAATACSSSPAPDDARNASATSSASAEPAPAADALPTETLRILARIAPGNPGLVDATRQIASENEPRAMAKAAEKLIAAIDELTSAAQVEALRAEIAEQNKGAGVTPTAEQLGRQLDVALAGRISPVLEGMDVIGGEQVAQRALALAEDASRPVPLRARALAIASKHLPAESPARPRLDEAQKSIRESRADDGDAGSVADASKVVASLSGPLRRCYTAELQKKPDLEASGQLVLKIGPDGKVTEAKSDVAPPSLAACVEGVGKAATFSAPTNKKGATVKVPLVFAKK